MKKINSMNYPDKIFATIIILIISLLIANSCKKATLPGVTTGAVTRIQQTSAYSDGKITSDGGDHISKMGVCWSTSPGPTVSDNKTVDTTLLSLFTSHITGLTPNTMYYLKAYATNSVGTAYGNEVTFTTLQVAVPTLTTKELKSVTLTTAAGGGNISNDGGLAVTARGVCWNTTGSPTITESYTSDGSGDGLFVSTLVNLTIGTKYYIRAYATNSLGTSYGNELAFTHIEPVTDQDGNAYGVVTIGTQIWMGENLKTTTFNDGLAIPYVSDGRDWANTTTPAFCWYNNDESDFKETYGALYNWHAVNTGKLCPAGWHVPAVAELTTLITYLGGEGIAGGKLKEAGTAHWAYPNLGATNGSGFTSLPGGGRYNIHSEPGVFSDLGYGSYIWSATESTNDVNAYSYDVVFNLTAFTKHEYSKRDGGAVRCIKNSH